MTEAEAFRLLRKLLVEVDTESVVLGLTCDPLTDIIRAHQQSPRPPGAHAVITPLGSRDSGEGFGRCFEAVTIHGVERIIEARTTGVAYGFRIDVFASQATDTARAFHGALRSARAELDLLPFVISEVEEVDNSPAIIEQTWEGRAKLAVTLTAARTQRTLIDVIESGNIGFIGSGGGRPTVTTDLDYAKE